MAILIYMLYLQLFFCYVKSNQDTYRAAVVDYTPILTAKKPLDRVQENVREFLIFIEEAAKQKVQIIVFPEDALTGWRDVIYHQDIVAEISTEVPDPKSGISPCISENSNFTKSLIDFSCAAKTHRLYVVVNLVEKRFDPTDNKMIYHNTNVVFDRNGRVIARYRKINLLNENLFEPGNELSTFKTDFGVKFGVFTCFDIMFKNPALDVLLDPEVTDVVFPVAWFSELPFLQGLSVHHGYTTATGVNMLAAGLDDPSSRNGGTAIYLAGGKIGKLYISGTKGSKMLVHDVPKISATKSSCQNFGESTEAELFKPTNIESFPTIQEDMTNYTFKSLDLKQRQISEVICSGESSYCCTFDITVNAISNPNYVYKLTAFHGTRLISNTLGIRNCGIVACLNESTTSCGGRLKEAPTGVTFEKISVKGIFNSDNVHDQPATLTYDLKPVLNYTFCRKIVDNKVEIDMVTTKELSTLLTFGIHGRVFNNENKPNGPIDHEM